MVVHSPFRAVLCVVLAAAWAASAFAQTPPPKALTLEGLVADALRGSESLSARDAFADAAVLGARQARAWPGTSFDIETGRKREGPDSGGLFRFGLAQPLPLSGRLAAQGGLGDLDVTAARVERSAAEVALTLDVVKLAYAYAGERGKAAFVAARQKRLELVREYVAGREFPTPQRKAESRLVGNRLRALAAEAVRTEAEFKVSFERLKVYAALGGAEYPELEVPWLAGETALPAAETLARALTADPELALLRLSVERARLETRLARAEGRPEPALTGYYEQAKALGTERSVALGFSLGFPFWNGNRSGVAGRERRAAAQERLLAFEERRLRAAVPGLVLAAEAARRTARSHPKALLAEVEEQLKEAEEGFRRGQVDLLTFLELDASASEALASALDAQTAYAVRLAEVFEKTQERDAASRLAGY